MSRYVLGKSLELIGLLCMPAALALGVRQESMSMELSLLGIGIVLFTLGWVVERGSRQNG